MKVHLQTDSIILWARTQHWLEPGRIEFTSSGSEFKALSIIIDDTESFPSVISTPKASV